MVQPAQRWSGNAEKLQAKGEDTDRLGLPSSYKSDASINSLGPVQQLTSVKVQNVPKTDGGLTSFDEMKRRFLNFKKHKYLEEVEHFQTLAEVQSPKFMVIACVDSRVCPSNVVGFKPGEAFMVRNVANIVPPLENGPTETNAALEFAVNTLEVENIFVIGHSNCAGIEALMSMQDESSHSFVEKWVATAKAAKLRTKADASGLSFDQQCKNCEKESINCSLLNLLTYPWIEEKVRKEMLSVHGGYYDFLNCTFEKWTLDFKEISNVGQGWIFSAKDRELWTFLTIRKPLRMLPVLLLDDSCGFTLFFDAVSRNVDGMNYFHKKVVGLLFVATTRVNVSPSLVLELLQRIARVIKDYLGTLIEDSLRKNFVLVYELLDEVIDFGYVQATSIEVLKSNVFNEPIVIDVGCLQPL
ncbi:hypothetical protein GH714_003337 [Hevea brasiliensis]|uniref:carbonic anhydrase n=1 Tax=Hevea brasiliensis TaxID=3981 RepID=A0A6A6LFJ5_HEVBR|nr:hypothetical protein GH714_003337 [Hevea brasiliensis]